MNKQKGVSTLVGIIIIIVVAVVLFGGVFAYQYFSKSQQNSEFFGSSQKTTQTQTQTSGWKTYVDGVAGITFQYPAKLNTDYISLTKPSVIITSPGSNNIDINGCYIDPLANNSRDTHITLGSMKFCASIGGEGGSPGFYDVVYYYTTLHSGDYYTLAFDITEPSCGNIGGPTMSASDPNYPRYKACVKDQADFDAIIMTPVKESVATLKFTK